jgi:peptidoglycan/xylan/chitin deacetylase (PgdA/CDA1 family)
MDSATGSRPWRPTPAIRVSIVGHVVGAAALAAQPESWPLVLATLLGNHLLLGAAVLLPRSGLLGRNLVRLPESAARRGEVALTFDDGPDPTSTARVLDVLDGHRAKASFFCIGEKAAAHPELVREIARRGHSVENHSYAHSHAFAFYGVSRLRREVEAGQAAIAEATGRRPQFFRAPSGFRNPLLDPVLARLGLNYVSWTRRGFDAVQRNPGKVFERLATGLAGGDILLLHDSGSPRTVGRDPAVLVALRALLAAIAAKGLKSVALPTAFEDGSEA